MIFPLPPLLHSPLGSPFAPFLHSTLVYRNECYAGRCFCWMFISLPVLVWLTSIPLDQRRSWEALQLFSRPILSPTAPPARNGQPKQPLSCPGTPPYRTCPPFPPSCRAFKYSLSELPPEAICRGPFKPGGPHPPSLPSIPRAALIDQRGKSTEKHQKEERTKEKKSSD
jgi:hypothetical protein